MVRAEGNEVFTDRVIKWQHRLYPASNSSSGVIRVLPDDDILVGGVAVDQNGRAVLTLARLTPQGTTRWQRELLGASPTSIAVLENGNIAVGGRANEGPFADALVWVLTADGTEVWRWTQSGSTFFSGDSVADVETTPDGSIYASSTVQNEESRRTLLSKFSSAGRMLWQADLGPGDAGPLEIDEDGNVFVTASMTVGPQSANGQRELSVLGMNGEGQTLWTQVIRGAFPGEDAVTALALHPGGGVVVTGRTHAGAGFFDSSFTTARLALSGAVLWQHDIGVQNSSAFDVVVQADGVVTAAGYVTLDGMTSAGHVVRLTASGEPVWSFDVPAPCSGYIRWMAQFRDVIAVSGQAAAGSCNAESVAYTALVNSGDPAPVVRMQPTSISASSTHTEVFNAGFATDQNRFTRWSSDFSDGQWLQVDLGEATTIDRVHIVWEMARAAEYEVQASVDGDRWTTLRNVTATGDEDDLVDLNGYGRFVRMRGVRRATHWGYSLYEFEVYRNGNNIAAGRPASASSAERNTFPASWVVDRNPSTRWSSDFADAQRLEFDFGRTVSFDRMVLSWERAYGSEYAIQASDDRVSWTNVRTVSDGDGAIDELDDLQASGRYLRLLLHRRGTPWGFSLWEVAVFGRP